MAALKTRQSWENFAGTTDLRQFIQVEGTCGWNSTVIDHLTTKGFQQHTPVSTQEQRTFNDARKGFPQVTMGFQLKRVTFQQKSSSVDISLTIVRSFLGISASPQLLPWRNGTPLLKDRSKYIVNRLIRCRNVRNLD